MDVLIVVESFYGNTTHIAEQIADGMRSKGATVTVASPAQSPDVDGVELLLVGAPTHMRGLPGARSRQMAAARGAAGESVGVSDWLSSANVPKGLRSAAFDTAVAGSFAGSATKAIQKRLKTLGASVVAQESFLVEGKDVPHLRDGELDRAAQWGASLL